MNEKESEQIGEDIKVDINKNIKKRENAAEDIKYMLIIKGTERERGRDVDKIGRKCIWETSEDNFWVSVTTGGESRNRRKDLRE